MRMDRGLIRDQLSIWYPLHDDLGYIQSTSLFLLARDVSNHIMPIGGKSSTRKDFSIHLTPNSEEFLEFVATALGGRDYHPRWQLANSACEFISRCSASLLEQGEAVYEIVFLKDPKSGEKKNLLFKHIDGRTLFEGREGRYQYRSPEDASRKRRKGAIFLPTARLIIFRLPHKYRGLMRKRKVISELGGMDVFRVAAEQQKTRGSVYNFKEHSLSEQLALASSTRETGWKMGAGFDGNFLEYYEIWRLLIYNRFVIELRDEIIRTLDQAIRRVSLDFGPETGLVVEGLPDQAEVEQALAELASGSRTFVSFVDQFSLL